MSKEPLFTMYTTTWCGDCMRIKQWLRDNNYTVDEDFVEINIEEHPDSIPVVEKLNNGYRSVPTLVFGDGSVLTEPSNQELEEQLESLKNHGTN